MRSPPLIARAFGWAGHQLDRLLHPSIREGNQNEHWLSRLLVLVCLAMQFGLWRAAFGRFVLGVPIDLAAVVVSALVALVLLSIPVVLRITGRFRMAAHVFQGAMTTCMTLVNLMSGGMTITIMGTTNLVVTAMILLGGRAGLTWAVIGGGQLLFTFLLVAAGYEFPAPVDPELAHSQQPLTALMSLCLLTAFMVVHEQLRREAFREVEAARDEARAAARSKSAFLANMSHEIRTPMNGVLGMAELLLATDLDPTQRQYAETVQRSGSSLLGIINDILDFSKIEAGKMDIESVAFDLDVLLADCAGVFALQAEKKGIGLIASVAPGTPQILSGDPTRLRQVLLNLMGNAFKFTAEGRVTVRAEAQPSDPGDCRRVIRFEVRDTGIGIAAENQTKLFRAFQQEDGSTTRRFGGTGLGLSISRRLSELMGGEIGVESEPGQGACFWFTAAMPEAPVDALPGQRDLVDLAGRRLLVVDDDVTFCEVVREQADQWGMDVTVAYHGEEGLTAIRAAAADDRPFDLISLDWEMPGMTGLEVSRAIQDDPTIRSVPRLLLTAVQMRPSADDLAALGLCKVISKPAAAGELRHQFGLALGLADGPSSARSDLDEGGTFPGLRVLVAEDNRVNQMVVKAMLKKLEVEAKIVSDGRGAVDAVLSAETPWDVVLMDCEMPELDGFGATAEIRGWESQTGRTELPIVALTANVVEDARDRMTAVGMSGFIAKPIVVQELLALFRGLTHDGASGRVPDAIAFSTPRPVSVPAAETI